MDEMNARLQEKTALASEYKSENERLKVRLFLWLSDYDVIRHYNNVAMVTYLIVKSYLHCGVAPRLRLWRRTVPSWRCYRYAIVTSSDPLWRCYGYVIVTSYAPLVLCCSFCAILTLYNFLEWFLIMTNSCCCTVCTKIVFSNKRDFMRYTNF